MSGWLSSWVLKFFKFPSSLDPPQSDDPLMGHGPVPDFPSEGGRLRWIYPGSPMDPRWRIRVKESETYGHPPETWDEYRQNAENVILGYHHPGLWYYVQFKDVHRMVRSKATRAIYRRTPGGWFPDTSKSEALDLFFPDMKPEKTYFVTVSPPRLPDIPDKASIFSEDMTQACIQATISLYESTL